MKRLAACLMALVVALAMLPAYAVTPSEMLPNPADEARARRLGLELRCLVCQNQSIDDSDASLARDLRLLVRERVQAGDSDEAIRTFLVARYGEFILLRPRFGAHTLLLWGLPVVALVLGGFGARALFRRRGQGSAAEGTTQENALSLTEAEELKSILGKRASE